MKKEEQKRIVEKEQEWVLVDDHTELLDDSSFLFISPTVHTDIMTKLEDERNQILAEQQKREEEERKWRLQGWYRKNTDSAFQEAFEMFQDNRFKVSKTLCDRILQTVPNPETFLLRAMIWKNEERYEKAIEDCNRAIELDPFLQQAYWIRGEILHHTIDRSFLKWSRGLRKETAISDLSRVTESDPNYTQAQTMVKELKADEGKVDYFLLFAVLLAVIMLLTFTVCVLSLCS